MATSTLEQRQPSRGLERFFPGLAPLLAYRREWFARDVVAGLSVAAVALPVGIAYARVAGFPPAVGIYSSILPAIAYVLFGSSRQLIVNPDAAACAILAATLAPLAAGNDARYWDLSIALTFLTGLFCLAGGMAGLGAIANFLSRPILTGYLNGIALSIIAGQLATLLGLRVPAGGFFLTLARDAEALGATHLPTLAMSVMLLALLWLLRRLAPRAPAPLVAAAFAIAGVYALGLDRHGMAVVGTVPAGFPMPRIPKLETRDLWPLTSGAAGIALVSFCSMMTTARGFAAKNKYRIAVNQEMVALGMSDIASAFGRGFVVSGADSRTAVADAAGGKTQATALVAAFAMALVLIFLTRPLAYRPTAALAAILVSSAAGLFDIASLENYWRVSKAEFRHAIVAMLGVMTVGVLTGILVAVGLAMLRLVRLAAHPHDALLGADPRTGGAYCGTDEGGVPIEGVMIYRFDASLVFFNADYIRDRALALVDNAEQKPRWFLLDAETVPLLDITGAEALEALRTGLADRGIVLALARAKGLFLLMLEKTGVAEKIGPARLFPRIHAGVEAFLAEKR
jgi:high affinity sulfate transporter 1